MTEQAPLWLCSFGSDRFVRPNAAAACSDIHIVVVVELKRSLSLLHQGTGPLVFIFGNNRISPSSTIQYNTIQSTRMAYETERRMSTKLRKIIDTHRDTSIATDGVGRGSIVKNNGAGLLPSGDGQIQLDLGRSQVVEIREGRPWHIVMDTPAGHAKQQMEIVPGLVQYVTAEDEELEAQERQEEAAREAIRKSVQEKLNFTSEQKTRLLTVSSLMLQPQQQGGGQQKNKASKTMGELMEEDFGRDPDLNIPIFGPVENSPPPVVEISEEAEEELARPRRQSVFKQTMAKNAAGNKLTSFAALAAGHNVIGLSNAEIEQLMAEADSETEEDHEPTAMAWARRTLKRQEIQAAAAIAGGGAAAAGGGGAAAAGGDGDDDDLFVGFGHRPERTGVGVRKFVRRNKLLKRLFRRKENRGAPGSKHTVIADTDGF